MKQQEIALRAGECAKLAGVSESTLRIMGRLGLIPIVRIGVAGRGVRFIPQEVIAALKARSTRTANGGRGAQGERSTSHKDIQRYSDGQTFE